MQISVESTGGLGRRMTVAVPAEKIDPEIENRLRSLSQRAKIDGFRPGKVPMKVIRKRYDQQVRLEVIRDVVQASFYEAANQEKLRPAGMPKIEPQNRESGQPLEFTATFEVYPEIDLGSLAKISLEKPAPEVTEGDVDMILERMRKQAARWNEVERGAEQGDRVYCDFVGTVNGAPFEGNEGKLVRVEIGANRFIPGFEEQLIGIQGGEERTLSVTFPDNYPAKELAGKAAEFATKAHRIEAAELPEIDAEFARRFGVESGDIADLRRQVRDNIERETAQMIQQQIKNQTINQILEQVTFELPRSLLDFELQKLEDQHQMTTGGKGAPFPREDFEKDLDKQLRLGLVMSEIVRKQNLSVSPSQLREAVEKLAQSYQQPEQVVKYYYADEERLNEARNNALEQLVIEWIVGQSQVKDVPITIDALMNPGQTQK